MTHASNTPSTASFLQGGGEMGARVREYDWSQTSLGAPEQWQQSLKTAVRIMLTSRQPMWVWWGEDLINLYNDAYRTILGGKHPEMLGQPASVVWHEIWDQVGPRAESVMFKNEATYDESLLLIMERNGYPEETYYTFSYSPIPDDQGGTGGILCANTDNTQQVISERQLALLQELAAKTADARTFDEACTLSAQCLETNLYDLPFTLIYLVDSERQQVSLAGTSGLDRGHLLAPEIVALEQNSVWHFSQVIQSQQPAIVSDLAKLTNELPTGAWQQALHQAVLLPIVASGETGKAGILIVGLNPFRLFDDNYRGFLNLVSRQIAASIANAQAYEEERKRAEALAELDRTKTVFFSNISHEFRTPLTLMLGPTEDALNDLAEPLSPTQQERIEIVQRNCQRLLKLVNTLLDFSRIESGRVQAVYEPTDLAAFTAELASVFRAAIERANMRLIVDCPPLPESVYVDREMWEKSVLNLLSNAFKFTFEGDISVRLQWQDSHVKLAVRDTGIGIPAAELPHLFERFHRVKGAQGRSFEGSGIGLSLVQELVKLHQGTIEVASVEGEGTCFTIAIPTGTAHLPQERIRATRTLTSTALGVNAYVEEALRWLPKEAELPSCRVAEERNSLFSPAPLSPLAPNPQRQSPQVGGPAQGAGSSVGTPSPPCSPASTARILLVDDNADMRDYVKRLLSQQYEVEAVSDGLAALAAVRQQVPDLVLTDVMMPQLDGFGLLQALRANPNTREVPILLLSARAGEEARIEGLAAGADDYLTKPFSARELLSRVEASLKLAQLRREATQREQALRLEAEAVRARLESVLAGINDQFIVLDREWRYTFVNDQVMAVTGKRREELLGHCVWDVFPDMIGTPFDVALRRAVAEQTFVQVELFYPPFQRWFENRIYPFADGVTIFVSDISERKLAEASLRQSESRFRLIVESAKDYAIFTLDLNGVVTGWNVGAERLLGYSEVEIIGGSSRIIFTPEDREQGRAEREMQIALTQGRAENERWHVRKDKSRFWASGLMMPLQDEAGNTQGFVKILQDKTAQKQTEAQREQLLQREQAAREEAENANRIKDEFLAVLSHELRSPLNPILGWSKLLQNGKLDAAKTKQALTTIERNAKLQSELIEDLLDVSRILQGKLSLTVSPINLAITIRAALETVRLAAEAKSIQIEIALDPEVGQVAGDATRLQQVVWNLLSNAVKFTSAGGRVAVRLEQIDHQAQITVSDTGKGIPSDFLPYVFDYFRQADGTTTRKFGGLGLGLAIVRHLVELHGGTVEAASGGEGMGATFTVKLPLMPTQLGVGLEHSSSEPSLDLHGVQVLVIDDEADSREFVAFVLEQAGAIVTTAATASEGFLTLMQSPPNVLLSDIGMPDMDGYMLMQQVRALPPEQGGQVKAIALTAYARDFDQQKALLAGFQAHITKPVEPEVLVRAIVNLLQKNRARELE